MKFIKSTLPILLFFLLPFQLFAQWYALPAPKMPHSWIPPFFPVYVPAQNIYPAANGEIIYDISESFGGPEGQYGIMKSQNDLGLDTGEFFDNGYGCCSSVAMYSANNLIHVFIEDKAGMMLPYYTTTNFNGLSTLNAFIVPYGGPIGITNDYIYIASQCSFEYNDSLYINRTTISSNTYKYKSFYSDSGTGKLYFVNDSMGFLLTWHRGINAPNILVETHDYGTTWNTIFSNATYNINNYCFPSKDTGYLILNDSVFKTTNGGTSWNKLSAPGNSYLSIQFANGELGYIGGSGGFLIKTTDGGTTWTNEISHTTNAIASLYTFGDSVAYFVDSAKNIFKNQRGLSVAKIQSPSSNLKIFPNPSEGVFTLDISSDLLNAQVNIYDVLGRPVYYTQLAQEQSTINISTLARGIYYLRLVSASGRSLLKKIVKE